MTATIRVPLGRRRTGEFAFRKFFEMGLDESASPFLDSRGRRISKNLHLKSSITAAVLLTLSFLSFVYMPLSPLSETLLVAVYLIVGVPSLIDSIEDVFLKKDVNIDVLMTIAAFSAYFLGNGFEGALLLVLFSISGALEDVVTLKAKSSLSAIHSLAPTKAYVVTKEGRLAERAVQDVVVGSRIFVRQHEIVPLDGIIVEGESFVSTAHLTGESLPLRKRVGDEVASGAKLLDGSLTIQVTHTSFNSTVSRIVELITKAEAGKPRLERFFDRLSRSYALSIIAFSFAFALLGPLVSSMEYAGREGSVYRSLAFLIAASPCALILAVPIAYLSALSSLAKRGIVLKGGVVLDALRNCLMVAFDKTGTLTLGELSLIRIECAESSQKETDTPSEALLLSVAAGLERNATHPIARAIVLEADRRGVHPAVISEAHVVPGYGVEGKMRLDSRSVNVFVGDVKRFESNDRFLKLVVERRKEAAIVAALAIGEDLFLLSFEDRPRPSVAPMLQNLTALGREVVMLTGDNRDVARKIAAVLGIKNFEAELKPEDKLERIEVLSKEYGLAMVGDGINDAPALARATVGICMGQVGSTTAQEVSDVVLLRDNVELIDLLFSKAEKTGVIVMQNLILAACAIIGASIPALIGYVPLWLAVILHEGGTVIVGLNAIRLLKE